MTILATEKLKTLTTGGLLGAGTTNPDHADLHAALSFLVEIKSSLAHTRLFSAENPPFRTSVNKLVRTEGDIEEWMINQGYWEYRD
jgi:hypothetical protein